MDDVRLAAYFAQVSEDLFSEPDEPLTFKRVVRRAVEVIPGVRHCGLTLRARRTCAQSVASSDEVAARADALQEELNEGPCLDAAFEQHNFVVHDLRTETRWPQWASRTAELGLRSSMSIRLTAHHESVGALNLYGVNPGDFAGDQDIAMIFATYAAEALTKARLVSGLRSAMDSRHTIGMAQGVLAVRYDITFERAFQLLHRYSNDHNIKLRDLAEQVLERRSLPDPTELPGHLRQGFVPTPSNRSIRSCQRRRPAPGVGQGGGATGGRDGMDADIRMAALFAELSGELSSDLDGPLTFQRVVDRALEVVPGCDHCGLHLRKSKGKAESVTATDEVAAEADRIQDELQDGPCVDAAFQEQNFVVHDLLTDIRWPTWAARASALGIRSSMSIRLTANDADDRGLELLQRRAGFVRRRPGHRHDLRQPRGRRPWPTPGWSAACARPSTRGTPSAWPRVCSRCATTSLTSAPSRCCTATPTTTT